MIELLDFTLPTTANPAFTVPVSAQPQAIWLETKAMSGVAATDRRHEASSQGAWGNGTQFAQGFYHTDLTVSSNPRMITSLVDVLRIVDDTSSELSVKVDSVSASAITLNVSGSLIANTIRVIGFAISGIENAYATAKLMDAIPLVFDGVGWQGDFVMTSLASAPPNNVVRAAPSAGSQMIGAANASQQACIAGHTHASSQTTAVGSHNADSVWVFTEGGTVNRLYAEFTADGVQFPSRISSATTSAAQTIGILLLKGVDSSIQPLTTPVTAGNEDLAFPFAPEGMVLAGGGALAWNSLVNRSTTQWPQQSRAFVTPGETVGSAAHFSGSGNGPREKHRFSQGTALRGILPQSTPTFKTDKYQVDVNSFDAQAAQVAHSLNGTGNPAGAYGWLAIALAAKTAQAPGSSHHPFGRGPWM